MRRTSPRSEGGFTLIELLIAVTVMGMIISALATGFIVAMRATNGAHNRFVASNAAQTFSSYLTSDVQSADPALVTSSAVGTGCATEPPGTTTNVLRLQWSEMSTATKMTAFSASYRTQQDASGTWQIGRYFCTGSLDPGSNAATILAAAPLTSHIVANNLSNPVAPYKPVVAISGRKITLQVFAALAAGETTPYSYNLVAEMRRALPYPYVLSINRAGVNPTNAATATWTVTFNKTVTGVDLTDFAVASGPALTGASVTTVSGSGATRIVTVGTGSGDDVLGLNLVDDDTIVDTAVPPNKLGGTGTGNGNFTGQGYTVDKTAPTVTIDQQLGQTDPTAFLPIDFAVTFSEPVSGFDATDVIRTGTATGGTVTVTGTRANYDVLVAGLIGGGTVIINIVAGKAQDGAGNLNTTATSVDNSVTYSLTAPPVVAGMVRADADPTTATSLNWTVTFSSSVTGVGPTDFALAPTGSVTGASITGVTGSGTTYTVTANRGSGAGALGLNLIDDDSIKSGVTPLGGPGANNGNFTGQVYTISGTITSVQLKNGGTLKNIDQGDSVIVTFSRLMQVSTFCSAWTSGNSNSQSDTNAVAVTVADNAVSGNDSLTVTASDCTFNFGSINLGSSGYVTGGSVTFSGNGVNKSSIAWNPTSLQLTITLGRKGGAGTQATVASSTPLYTASASIKDSTGAGVSNSPFTIPAGAQF
jgi:prepilin-type N-terminal cleavage/methylation domain-containing protein